MNSPNFKLFLKVGHTILCFVGMCFMIKWLWEPKMFMDEKIIITLFIIINTVSAIFDYQPLKK